MPSSLRKYNYRRNLPHLQKDYRPVFVTFDTKERWQLAPAARSLTLEACRKLDGVMLDLHVAVVMPDHVHLIFTARRDLDTSAFALPEIMKRIKGASARAINKELRRSGQVWQEESFDHVLRSNESLSQKVEYVCQNPVRAGLVQTPEAYPWLWRGEIPVL
jgi:REP element-mobilizing transposase RayT